jgi:hypothetical protein
VILHEGPQKRCMTLLFSNEQFDYSRQVRQLLEPRVAFGRSPELPALGLLAELKCRDGARDALQFIAPQDIGQTVRNTGRMPHMMFEVIQPDLEIHRTHATPS